MPNSSRKSDILELAEGTVYLALFCFLVYPLVNTIWQSKGFLSLDGPAHVYNALLIKQLLTNNMAATSLFALNPFPVPNLLGHALLVVLTRFFSPVEAEKLVVIISMMLIPIGAWALGSSIQQKKGLLAALLTATLAFCSFTFLGFYNYLLSIGLALVAMGLFVRLWPKGGFSPFFWLNLMGLLVYSAHLFSLVLLGLFMGVWAMVDLASNRNLSLKPILSQLLRVAGMLALPLLLSAIFLLIGKKGGDVAELNFSARWVSLWEGRLFYGLIPEQEKPWAQLLSMLMGVAGGLTALSLFRRKGNDHTTTLPIAVAVVAAVVLVLVFFAPTGLAAGGYVVERFQLMALVTLAMLAAFALKGASARLLLAAVAAYFGLEANDVRLKYLESHFEHYHAQALQLAGQIEPNGTVVSLSLSDNWFEGHFTNLIAAYSPNVLMTNNYEADQGYFPVIWKGGKSPFLQTGSVTDRALDATNHCKAVSGNWPSNVLVWRGDLLSPPDRQALIEALPNYQVISPQEGYYLLFGLKN